MFCYYHLSYPYLGEMRATFAETSSFWISTTAASTRLRPSDSLLSSGFQLAFLGFFPGGRVGRLRTISPAGSCAARPCG